MVLPNAMPRPCPRTEKKNSFGGGRVGGGGILMRVGITAMSFWEEARCGKNERCENNEM